MSSIPTESTPVGHLIASMSICVEGTPLPMPLPPLLLVCVNLLDETALLEDTEEWRRDGGGSTVAESSSYDGGEEHVVVMLLKDHISMAVFDPYFVRPRERGEQLREGRIVDFFAPSPLNDNDGGNRRTASSGFLVNLTASRRALHRRQASRRMTYDDKAKEEEMEMSIVSSNLPIVSAGNSNTILYHDREMRKPPSSSAKDKEEFPPFSITRQLDLHEVADGGFHANFCACGPNGYGLYARLCNWKELTLFDAKTLQVAFTIKIGDESDNRLTCVVSNPRNLEQVICCGTTQPHDEDKPKRDRGKKGAFLLLLIDTRKRQIVDRVCFDGPSHPTSLNNNNNNFVTSALVCHDEANSLLLADPRIHNFCESQMVAIRNLPWLRADWRYQSNTTHSDGKLRLPTTTTSENEVSIESATLPFLDLATTDDPNVVFGIRKRDVFAPRKNFPAGPPALFRVSDLTIVRDDFVVDHNSGSDDASPFNLSHKDQATTQEGQIASSPPPSSSSTLAFPPEIASVCSLRRADWLALRNALIL